MIIQTHERTLHQNLCHCPWCPDYFYLWIQCIDIAEKDKVEQMSIFEKYLKG